VIEKIEEELKEINPNVVTKRTKYCEIDLDQLFDHQSFNDLTKKKEELQSYGTHDFEHKHADKKFQFLVYEFEDVEFDQTKLDRIFGVLLWEKPDNIEIIRCKGLINMTQSNIKFSLQG
jgi:G3E family GTPase